MKIDRSLNSKENRPLDSIFQSRVLSGTRALVTGSAVRVGREFCRALKAVGAEVVIHYRSSENDARELAAELNAVTVQGDLTLAADRERIFKEVGKFNALINSASTYVVNPLLDEPENIMRCQLEANLIAPLEMMKLFRQQLNGEPGSIVNIVDQEVFRAADSQGGYSLAKKSLRDATLASARQYANENLRVNAIAPGPVLPPVGFEGQGMIKALRDVPLGRPVAMCDLTAALIFLLSNSSITGQILAVDCGQHLNC
mgnify:CR=1 FL=1